MGSNAVLSMAVLALVLSACGPGDESDVDAPASTEAAEEPSASETEDEENEEEEEEPTPEAEPEAEPEPTPEPPRDITDEKLREALLSAEDLSETLQDVVEHEDENGDSQEDGESPEMIAGDEACFVMDEDQDANRDDSWLSVSFGWAEGNRVHQNIGAFPDADDLPEEIEAYLDLQEECQRSVYSTRYEDVTREYSTLSEADLDPRYLELGDWRQVRIISDSTESHGVYDMFVLVDIQIEHVFTAVHFAAPEQISDEIALPIVERAVERVEALLADPE